MRALESLVSTCQQVSTCMRKVAGMRDQRAVDDVLADFVSQI